MIRPSCKVMGAPVLETRMVRCMSLHIRNVHDPRGVNATLHQASHVPTKTSAALRNDRGSQKRPATRSCLAATLPTVGFARGVPILDSKNEWPMSKV